MGSNTDTKNMIVGYELALEDLMIYRDLDYHNIIHIIEYVYA